MYFSTLVPMWKHYSTSTSTIGETAIKRIMGAKKTDQYYLSQYNHHKAGKHLMHIQYVDSLLLIKTALPVVVKTAELLAVQRQSFATRLLDENAKTNMTLPNAVRAVPVSCFEIETIFLTVASEISHPPLLEFAFFTWKVQNTCLQT